jgi:hypothetical protein
MLDGMGNLIVFFPIWLTSLILFAAIPTHLANDLNFVLSWESNF